VVFPPGVDHWPVGVTLVMQPPLQAHMSIAVLLSAVAALALVALFAQWLVPVVEDRAGGRERAWYPEF
jgi:peptidoglycan/LPS O-acetylase OafA/YrhL